MDDRNVLRVWRWLLRLCSLLQREGAESALGNHTAPFGVARLPVSEYVRHRKQLGSGANATVGLVVLSQNIYDRRGFCTEELKQ